MTNGDQSRRFGSVLVDLRTGEVQKNGRKLKLQEQPFQVLAALIERPGEVVTREELQQRVWPANTFVDFNNGLNIAIVKLRQALNDDAAKPRFIETLPRRGYRFIAPVEAPTPAVEQAVEVPAEVPAGAEVEPTPAPRHGQSRWTILAMAAGGLLILILAWVQFLPQSGTAIAAITPRTSAAVMGFQNLTGNPADDWLSVALAEMISTELAGGDRLRIVSRESIARARLEMPLEDVGSYSPRTLSKIRKNLEADYVVAGAYLNAEGQPSGPLRLDLRLQDARTGQTVAIAETGTRANLSDLAYRAGLALRQKLNVAAAPQVDPNSARGALPAGQDNARLYAEGLTLLRRFDAAGARSLLQQVVTSDPDYALAHAALSRAWMASGYGERAKQEAKKAWDLSHDLPWEGRLAIEANYRGTNGEWDRAAEIYQQLRDRFPDDVDYGLGIATAQIRAGKGTAALASLDKLRKLPAPLRDDPAIDFTQSLAAEQSGDLQQSQTAAAKAATAAEARGASMLVAESKSQQCRVLRALGNPDAARGACERAREIYAGAGDRGGAAVITGILAAIRGDEGDLAAAQELYTRALAIDREIGSEANAIWELNGLADTLWTQGDLAGARRKFGEALEIARQTGDRSDQADEMDNVAAMFLLEGDLNQASALFEQALEQYRAMPDRSGVGNALGNLGETLYLQGDLARAAHTLEQAAAANREAGSQAETADALETSGRVLLAQGNPDAARRRFDEAAGIWTAMGSARYLAKHRLRMAELALETGRPAEAEALTREGLQVLERGQQRDNAIEGSLLLTRALLAEGKADEARRQIESAQPWVKKSQSHAVRLEFATTAALARANSGKLGDAKQAVISLQDVIADARTHGFVGRLLEAELAKGEVEYHANLYRGTEDLAGVEHEARARGFVTIAGRATTALGQKGVSQ